MTDTPTYAAVPLTADEETQLAALQARAAAAAMAKADAAKVAVQQLVADPEFKSVLAKAEAALSLAPKEQRLSYAVNMMEQLASAYAA